MPFSLPDLPYSYNALEPHIDARTMEIHHKRHHNLYISNLNNAIVGTDQDNLSIALMELEIAKEFAKTGKLKKITPYIEQVKKSDLIILHTEWDEFKSLDFKSLVKKKNFKIYDMRNLYNPNELKKKNIKYYSVGR